MVKRDEFEKELMKYLVPAVTQAQDELEKKYGLKFSVNIDWELAKGHFEDEKERRSGIGG